MSDCLRLGPEHAEAIAEAQADYPVSLRDTVDKLRKKLTLLDQSDFSCAWGLFEHDALIGYVIAFPRRSQYEDRGDEIVVGVDDLWISSKHTHRLYSLLKILQFDLEEAQLGSYDIEANSRRSFYRLLEKHPEVFRRLGYEILGTFVYWEEAIGEEMCWIRLSPLVVKAPSRAHDAVELSEALMEEMRYDSWDSE